MFAALDVKVTIKFVECSCKFCSLNQTQRTMTVSNKALFRRRTKGFQGPVTTGAPEGDWS